MNSEPGFDALLPQEIARTAELIGREKTRMDGMRLLVLAILAGAFIAFGGMLATIVATGAGAMPMGVVRILSGVVFSLGLILVVVGGAELFTGNNLMVMAWASGKTSFGAMIAAWTIVYAGNFFGGVATACLVFLSGLHQLDGGAVGSAALTILERKAELPFSVALFKGILANVLVCLAIWLSYGAHSITDKILAVVPPVAAFVAAGFEHSIANMYLIPFGLLIVDFADPAFWNAIGQDPAAFAGIGWDALAQNLTPVTIGNVIGGGVLVGAVYWFVYLRKSIAEVEKGK